jgi:Zn finger protein HypA/HybF involved in hydrogenase expression
MHEHSFIQAIISEIDNKDDVLGIYVEVGELVGITASHLKEHLVEETGWEVDVCQKDALVECCCGHKGEPKIRERLHDMVIFECSRCGLVPDVTEGKDIKILKVKYK